MAVDEKSEKFRIYPLGTLISVCRWNVVCRSFTGAIIQYIQGYSTIKQWLLCAVRSVDIMNIPILGNVSVSKCTRVHWGFGQKVRHSRLCRWRCTVADSFSCYPTVLLKPWRRNSTRSYFKRSKPQHCRCSALFIQIRCRRVLWHLIHYESDFEFGNDPPVR